jgi:hypothetical protein
LAVTVPTMAMALKAVAPGPSPFTLGQLGCQPTSTAVGALETTIPEQGGLRATQFETRSEQ